MASTISIDDVKKFVSTYDESDMILSGRFNELPFSSKKKLAEGLAEKKWIARAKTPDAKNFFELYFKATSKANSYEDMLEDKASKNDIKEKSKRAKTDKASDDDSNDDSVEAKPKPKAKGKAKATTKPAAKTSVKTSTKSAKTDESDNDEPDEKSEDEPKPKSKPKASAKVSAKPRARMGRGTPFSQYPINGYSIMGEVDVPTDFPKVETTGDEHMKLVDLYTGSNDAYMNAYKEYADAIVDFEDEHDNIVPMSGDIFKYTAKTKSYSYKVKVDSKTRAVDLEDKSVVDLFEKYKAVMDDFKKTHDPVHVDADTSLKLLRSNLINTLDALDYAYYTKSCNLLSGFRSEETHAYLKVFGNPKSMNIDKVFEDLEQPLEQHGKQYEELMQLLKDVRKVNLPTKCVKIFKLREGVCCHFSLRPEVKKEMWLTALKCVSDMKDPDDIAKTWKHILESRFMYNIIMNCAKPAPWMQKGLEALIKDNRTIQMAIKELYPISFTFTPFMCGSANVELPSDTYAQNKIGAMVQQHFSAIFEDKTDASARYADCDWIYYALNNDQANISVSIVEPIVMSLGETRTKSDAKPKTKSDAKSDAGSDDEPANDHEDDDDDDSDKDSDDSVEVKPKSKAKGKAKASAKVAKKVAVKEDSEDESYKDSDKDDDNDSNNESDSDSVEVKPKPKAKGKAKASAKASAKAPAKAPTKSAAKAQAKAAPKPADDESSSDDSDEE